MIETVRADGFAMDYFKFGQGEKTMVILPGLSIQSVMGSADAVAEAYRQFAEDYTVFVFDRRRDPAPPYTAADTARDTAAAFRVLGLERACILGASYGGMAATELAIRCPELAETLVLASVTARMTEAEFRIIGDWIRLAEAGDAEALYLAFGEALYPAETFAQARDLLTDAAKTVTKEELARFVIYAEGIKGFDAAERLEQIRCPVLAVWDRTDRVLGPASVETNAERMGRLPGFETYLYDGCGHAVYDVAPDFKDRIHGFLRGKES